MTECMKESTFTVVPLKEDLKKTLSEILCRVEKDIQIGEISSVIFRDIDNRTILFQAEKDIGKPFTFVMNSLVGESRQYSYASSFTYVITHDSNKRQGERCCVTEYKDGAPSITLCIENKGFTYYGANPVYYGQHFYLEHKNNRCCLYNARKEVAFGQLEYTKTGNPLLCSA